MDVRKKLLTNFQAGFLLFSILGWVWTYMVYIMSKTGHSEQHNEVCSDSVQNFVQAVIVSYVLSQQIITTLPEGSSRQVRFLRKSGNHAKSTLFSARSSTNSAPGNRHATFLLHRHYCLYPVHHFVSCQGEIKISIIVWFTIRQFRKWNTHQIDQAMIVCFQHL